jgi:DNA-binding protein H-NS
MARKSNLASMSVEAL